MHIFDGVLSPQVCAVTGVLSIGAVGYSLHKLKDSLAERTVPLTGMMSALIFAGQMVNFPIGVPVSGHLLGGVLAGVMLGPWAGCLSLTVVLIVQCVLFSDGGVTALGANVLHMGVVGSIGGYAVYAAVRQLLGGSLRAAVVGSVVAAWLSVMAAAALFCIEFRLSHSPAEYDFSRIFTLMVTFHSIIGVGEALITGSVIGFVLVQRPDLIDARVCRTGPVGSLGRAVFAGLVCAMAVAAFAAPFASPLPDGLEAVAQRSSFDESKSSSTVLLLSEYKIPSPVDGWEKAATWEKISVSLAGLLGIAAVLMISILLGYSLRPRSLTPESNYGE